MPDPQELCAATARVRADPLLGTALHVRRFLLVEHPGPWPFHALEAEGLDPDLVRELVAATREVGGRTILIRRPGRRAKVAGVDELAWAVVDVAANRVHWSTWRTADDLRGACDVLRSSSDTWSQDPVVLVCAHGRHDACCAVRGRPVAAALAERHGDLVWECSHVGGDRFAANVVVLPDGTYYGGLDDDTALDVVEQHLDGRVTPEFLRGSSRFAPVAQAAAIGVHERWGPGSALDVETARVEVLETSEADVPVRWRVRLTCRGPLPGRVVAEVRARRLESAVLTCQAPRATSARTFVVDDLRAEV